MTHDRCGPMDELTQHPLDRLIYEALQNAGRLLPRTEADIMLAEGKLALAVVPIPGTLKDRPSLEQPFVRRTLALLPKDDQALAEAMARAARDGKEIPADIEEVMRRDRDAAERDDDCD